MQTYAPLPKSEDDEESRDFEVIEFKTRDDKSPSLEGNDDHTCFQTFLGWFCMLLAVIAGASVGPVFKYMMSEGIRPLISASWRNQTMVLALLPFAVFEAWSRPENRVQWFGYKPDLPFPVVVHVIISGLSWASNLLFWIVGLQYVSTFKASIVSSSHPVLLVLALRFKGHAVSMAEWVGVFVAFGGMFLSEYKSPGSAANPIDDVPFHLQLFGYALCLLAAAGEVVTILNRIKTRKYVPLLQYTVATSFIVACCATVMTCLLEGSSLAHDYHICFNDRCLLGWTSEKWRWKMVVFGLWVGAVCITGFNYAMQYIPPLVFSSITLIDPAVTAFISWFAGIEHLPGVFSWLGGCVVIGGVAIISYGERQRSAEERWVKHNTDVSSTTLVDDHIQSRSIRHEHAPSRPGDQYDLGDSERSDGDETPPIVVEMHAIHVVRPVDTREKGK